MFDLIYFLPIFLISGIIQVHPRITNNNKTFNLTCTFETTEEQARFTLHSHILLFIALFDALITLLWSNCEKVREEAQKELVEFLKKTMSSTYDLVEEDFIHETLLSTSNIQVLCVRDYESEPSTFNFIYGCIGIRSRLR